MMAGLYMVQFTQQLLYKLQDIESCLYLKILLGHSPLLSSGHQERKLPYLPLQ